MRLVQFLSPGDRRLVGWVQEDSASLQVLADTESVRDLALQASRQGVRLEDLVRHRASGETADYERIVADRRLLPPLDHPDPAHCLVTGTGLTHLGSAKARGKMHARTAVDAPQTDSMRLFAWGVEGGKPPAGKISVQPEWFYKGNGHSVIPPERPLPMPWFALDGGEEAELVGLYGIADLEHHHFKYDCFRQPGDVHGHFFGTATLSFSAGVTAEPGDVFELSAPPFGRALHNPLQKVVGKDEPVIVEPL